MAARPSAMTVVRSTRSRAALAGDCARSVALGEKVSPFAAEPLRWTGFSFVRPSCQESLTGSSKGDSFGRCENPEVSTQASQRSAGPTKSVGNPTLSPLHFSEPTLGKGRRPGLFAHRR
jgi:hypothetical protein